MNKKIKSVGVLALLIFLIVALLLNTTYAATSEVTLEKVKDNVCEIELDKDGKLVKKLISVDNEKKEATLQVDVTNLRNEEEEIKPSEIYLVIDNSKSMSDNKLTDGTTRKEAVFTAAKTLASKILEAQSTTKIGVVSFSTNSDAAKEGTIEDANLVINPSSNISDITTAIDSIKTTGAKTNIDAGLQVARSSFSQGANLNKYLILLTDGVPNTAVGGPTMTYSGQVTTKTKATLKSIVDNNINIITVMTGVNSSYKPDADGNLSPDAANKTYKDLAEEIFGTQKSPLFGKFYYVTDENVQDTIANDVYANVVIVKKNELKNITVIDYFPDNIIANYDFEIVEKANIGEVTATVNPENNSITWTIETLKAGETASFKYKLKLKENFDKNIINVETPTNKKVDVVYTNTDGEEKTETSNVSPSIILKGDNTKAPDPIPQAGDKMLYISMGILVLAIVLVVYLFKTIKNNK